MEGGWVAQVFPSRVWAASRHEHPAYYQAGGPLNLRARPSLGVLAENTVCVDAFACYVAFAKCPGCLVQPGGITLNYYELRREDSQRPRFAGS